MNHNHNHNRWLVLVAMTSALSMIMLDQTVVTVALPSMGRDLSLSPGGQQWVMNAYVLAMAALVALGGKLGDRLGGVTTFRIGVIIFFLASVGCGLAPQGSLGEGWLITARALQGAGAALMMPPSAAILMAVFPVVERGRAMALYAGIAQLFLAAGPLLGGALTQWASWRAVFWLNVPVGVAALILVHIARPDNTRRKEATIAARPVVLLVLGVGATVLAVQQGSSWSWTSPLTWGTLTSGVLITTWFVRSQLRANRPLVNLRLFARPAFLGDAVVLGLVQFGLLPVIILTALYLQDLLHFTPLQSGLAALPLVAAITAAAQLGGRWFDRAGVRAPVLTGLSAATVGMAAWAMSLPTQGYPWQLPGMITTGLGLGLLMSPTNTDALGRVAAAERSQASGLVQTIRQLGGTLGVAIITAVVLAVEKQGTRGADPTQAVNAVTAGFGCAAAAIGIALVAGWLLLARTRVTDDDMDRGPCTGVEEVAPRRRQHQEARAGSARKND